MKKVLISIQPQHVENILNGKKIIEIRKTMPECELPCKVYIYCSWGDRRMNYMLGKRGKVVAEFILTEVDFIKMPANLPHEFLEKACVNGSELIKYLEGNFCKDFYAWHINNLKIYDEPKELSEFYKPFKYDGDGIICGTKEEMYNIYEWDCETLFSDKYPSFKFENHDCKNCPKAKDFYRLKRPPQSWCYVDYVEELQEE